MQLDEKRVKEFIDIYEKECGEKLSLAEGREMMQRLLAFYLKILSPLPSERKRMGLPEQNPGDSWLC